MFFVTEDWFMRSHFIPMIERAVTDGWSVTVAARLGSAQNDLVAAGARVVDFSSQRRGRTLLDLWRDTTRLRALLAAEEPDVLHAISLKPILITALAGARCYRVYALTGFGYLHANAKVPARLVRTALAGLIRRDVVAGRASLLVENRDDLATVFGSTPPPHHRCAILPGAGVDVQHFSALPQPSAPPVRVGVAARLVRSKGVDLAVAAVRALRREGMNVELDIAGTPDHENPAAYSDAEIAGWAGPGVMLRGYMRDVRQLWTDVHIACLPSRGGEGLPRSLIEAGACARPIVTTDVPGCRDFAAGGEVGIVTPPEDVAALAGALRRLAQDIRLCAQMGAAARKRVEDFYTEQRVGEIVSDIWSRY